MEGGGETWNKFRDYMRKHKTSYRVGLLIGAIIIFVLIIVYSDTIQLWDTTSKGFLTAGVAIYILLIGYFVVIDSYTESKDTAAKTAYDASNYNMNMSNL